MKVQELFDRCVELATTEPDAAATRFLHETLVLCCAEATRQTGQGYGNLFAQVDYLCKRHRVGAADRVAIQTMRRHSNRPSATPLALTDWLYDVRAMALLVSAVFATDIPDRLVRLLPAANRPDEQRQAVNLRYVRCIVDRWDEHYVYANSEQAGQLAIDCRNQDRGQDLSYLYDIVREGMQLNLLDCQAATTGGTTTAADSAAAAPNLVVVPSLVVVEPDYLIDISAIAACFTDYGHHPLAYTVNRLRPKANSHAILLGNFASAALDDIVNHPDYQFADTLNRSFREQALQFCTCTDFQPASFVVEAQQQAVNLREVVDVLFGNGGTDGTDEPSAYERRRVVLEPSFVCERLGLQGRVDLMTTDGRLLVEQKSGKNYNIERGRPGAHQSLQREDHYVQLLLYYGVLRHNFGWSTDHTDCRLLYSKYPARQGLLVVNFYQQLFREAIRLRNLIVCWDFHVARQGFGTILPLLRPESLIERGCETDFFNRYVRPQIEQVTAPLQQLTPTEHAYLSRMMTFVYREQLLSKVGRQEGHSGAVSDLWNMPLSEKLEQGTILMGAGLTPPGSTPAREGLGVGFRLEAGAQGSAFRRGDMVYLYPYTDEPDARSSLLFRGTIEEMGTTRVVVRLNDEQHNPDIFAQGKWAIEPGGADTTSQGAMRGLCQLMGADPTRRALLLGQRAPVADTSLRLQRSYSTHYDDVVLRARQARDYFLLVGPPGTGKTSMALRFMVAEELAASADTSLLLTAYTNRAVDEICAMLSDAGWDYLRLSGETACDPRFHDHLIDRAVGEHPKLADLRRRIDTVRIIVSTTSMLQSRPFVLSVKHFSLCIVDEASQILEPAIVGLLASPSIGRFVLVGDHKQLPAVVQQTEQESAVSDPLLHAIGISDCRQSLFERLLRWEQSQGRTQFTGILRHQGRMHPDIASFADRHFYPDEHLLPVPLAHQQESALHYDLPPLDATDQLLQRHRVVFFDVVKDAADQPSGVATSDKENPAEARLVADLLRRIHRYYGARFDAVRTVGVIVPYRNQIGAIRQELDRLGISALADVSIDTVERYQGSQRDVIIYSFTVSRPNQLDFLTANCFEEHGRTIDRKLNVVLTRARKQLLLVGNAALLRQNRLFAELIEWSIYREN